MKSYEKEENIQKIDKIFFQTLRKSQNCPNIFFDNFRIKNIQGIFKYNSFKYYRGKITKTI